MTKPKLLDLFCKAGGAGYGYYLAGFEVTGVDIEYQKHYPFEFVQADAFVYALQHWKEYDAIHASPPCQRYSNLAYIHGVEKHPDLIPLTREVLKLTGLPYVIENVEKAPLFEPTVLCGTMFGIEVLRHRGFESNLKIPLPATCNHYKPVVRCGRRPDLSKEFHSICGHFSGVPEARIAMGIPWMGQEELREAIPPAYTKYIGEILMKEVLKRKEKESEAVDD